MKAFSRYRFLSYLDLMCCGFGGALLLFLLLSAAAPRQGVVNEMIVVRCFAAGEPLNPKAEVGIMFKRPTDSHWQPPIQGTANVRSFSARSGPNSGSEAFLVLLRPDAGVWEFAPFLKDFPVGKEGPTVVDLHIYGQGLQTLEVAGRGQPLPGIGEPGTPILRVRISR